MRQRLYSILLLSSFLMILIHTMIPHHHHELMGNEISEVQSSTKHHSHHHDSDLDHHHKNEDRDHEPKDASKAHNHPFPFHHHLNTATDLDYARLNLGEKSSVSVKTISILYALNSFTVSTEAKGECLARLKDKPFLRKSIFDPGATGLRAPPSIA